MRELYALYMGIGREDLYRKLVDPALVCPLGLWAADVGESDLLASPYCIEPLRSIDRRVSALNWGARLELAPMDVMFLGIRVGNHWLLTAGGAPFGPPTSLMDAKNQLRIAYGRDPRYARRIDEAAREWVEAVRLLRLAAFDALRGGAHHDGLHSANDPRSAVAVIVLPDGKCSVIREGDSHEIDKILGEIHALDAVLVRDMEAAIPK